MNRVNYHDRMNAEFFQCETGDLLRFTEHYTWSVVGSLNEFLCDEDTECPVFPDGAPISGFYVSATYAKSRGKV